MIWDDYYRVMLALTAWREARGEPDPHTSMRAVMHVIANRVRAGQGDWDHVITKKWQFSSMTATGDPELVLWPDSPDTQFEDAMNTAELVLDGTYGDITGGATFYFNPNIVKPDWASHFEKTCSIGHHDFYCDPATRRTN